MTDGPRFTIRVTLDMSSRLSFAMACAESLGGLLCKLANSKALEK